MLALPLNKQTLILELGTDNDTTELLHTVVQADNEIEKNVAFKRILVTTDSSSFQLNEHSTLLCSFHQFLFVPLYDNYAGCQQHRCLDLLGRYIPNCDGRQPWRSLALICRDEIRWGACASEFLLLQAYTVIF